METSEKERNQGMINNEGNKDNINNLDEEEIDDSTSVAREAFASSNFIGKVQPIGGNTISGSGSGPGTGDAGGDFDRPGSGGHGANDWVSHDKLNETNDTETKNTIESTELEKQAQDSETDKSYMPGSGAVRTSEDRISPGNVDKDSIPPGAGTF